MQSEGVVVAIISTVITTVVATSIVIAFAAAGPSGVLSLGCSSQSSSSLPAAAHELRLRSSG
jgi:hypothetical protein